MCAKGGKFGANQKRFGRNLCQAWYISVHRKGQRIGLKRDVNNVNNEVEEDGYDYEDVADEDVEGGEEVEV